MITKISRIRRRRGTGYPKAPVRRLLAMTERVLKACEMHKPFVREKLAGMKDSRKGNEAAGIVTANHLLDLHDAWEGLKVPRDRDERTGAESG